MPTAELIESGFTLVNAEHPSVSYEGGNLILTYVDWRERSVRVWAVPMLTFGELAALLFV